uniref:Uncharacterized protein n=1 Tax=Arundo donax TaxID=35708 RepID=A0A0A9HDV0_ARUDO
MSTRCSNKWFSQPPMLLICVCSAATAVATRSATTAKPNCRSGSVWL